jgi:GAF domain-containing protein
MTGSAYTGAMADGARALLDQIAERLKRAPGYDLFTVLAPAPGGERLDRLFSTNHAQYPLGPADEVENNLWFRRLFAERQPIVANTIDEISAWLPDYEVFIEQNYQSLLNLPVVYAGRTIGLVNMMGAEHHFDAASLERIHGELPFAALAILGTQEERHPTFAIGEPALRAV